MEAPVTAREADLQRILDAMAQMEGHADARAVVPCNFYTGQGVDDRPRYALRLAAFEHGPENRQKAERIAEFYTVLRLAGLLEGQR